MLKRTGKISFIIVLLFYSIAFAEDVAVEASINAEEIGLNDTLIYTLSITSSFNVEPSQIKFPDFKGFKKLSQSESSSMNIVIGSGQRFSRTKSYNVQLLPNKTGLIEIGPAVVVIKGKAYQTRSFKVNVLPASKSTQNFPSLKNFLRSPFDIDDLPLFDSKISDDDIILQAVVDKKTAFVGEEIVYSLYLYSAVQIYDIEQIVLPKFENMWVEDIYNLQKFTAEQKRIGHKTYNVYLIRRKALFPNKSGIYEIEPSSIILNVVSGFTQKRISKQTQSIKIDVRPLPEKNMPPDFPPYNVGEYKIYYSLTPNKQPMDKPFTLRIIIEGVGNINAFSIPKLKDNPELRFYDPVTNVDIQTENRIYKGKKSFEYLVFAKRTGKIQLPAFEIAYFKPSTESFEKVSVSGLFIESTEPESSLSIVKKSEIGKYDAPATIRFVNQIGSRFVGIKFGVFLILLMICPSIYLIFLLSDVGRALFTYLGFDSDISQSRRRLKKYIDKIDDDIKNSNIEGFSENIYLALSELIFIKFGINIKGLTRENLRQIFVKRNTNERLIDDIERLIDTCEMVKFAKGSIGRVEMENLHNLFKSVMRELDE